MNHFATIKQKISDQIEATSCLAIAHVIELVQMPSDNPPGNCAPIAELAYRQLRTLGFEVERYEVPAETVGAAGMQSVTNLVVRERFGEGPTIALNAHGDVVPPGSGWTVDPYKGEIIEGWLYGRGAAVSKSDLVSYAYALKALKESGIELAGTVELHYTFDEETGGLLGPGWLLEQGIVRPDYVICAAFSYDVIVAHNGCLHLEITLKGKSAHAAVPSTGVDAIEALVPVLQALYAYRDSLRTVRATTSGIDAPTFVVGLVKGGINTNVVADEVVLRVDRRVIPDEDPYRVEQQMHEVIAAALTQTPGITADIKRVLLANPMKPTKASLDFAQRLAKHAQAVMGEAINPAAGIPLYTDARLYAEKGIPTIMYGAGPRSVLEANGHRADERLPVDTLAKATTVIAHTIADMLGVNHK
ncbi:ArgE/DapE family deacylase [Paenalcaligenes niemegkensis]|uniref:ArgE/DapE family deacylase n=1 Tax=Paenalcaligenes niemegkensis TaxID=2895469 RepID=UPI001EE92216|nr:ArgE/DapE family deacylase [Paenalcaligenes niemegkensis]MCQ9617898.1 ArgE/DapE family deacylase [Paenalcaligenes niemegkensis]